VHEALAAHPDWHASRLCAETIDLLARIRSAPSILQVVEETARKSAHHKVLLAALHLHGVAIDSSPARALLVLKEALKQEEKVPDPLLAAAFELAPLTLQATWVTEAIEAAEWEPSTNAEGSCFQRVVTIPRLRDAPVFGDAGVRIEQLVSHALQFRSRERKSLPSDAQPKSVIRISFTYQSDHESGRAFCLSAPLEEDSICSKLTEIVRGFAKYLGSEWEESIRGTQSRIYTPLSLHCLTSFHALCWMADRSEQDLISLTLRKGTKELPLGDLGWGGLQKALDGTPPSELSDPEMYQVLAAIMEGGIDGLSPERTRNIQSAALAFAEQRQISAVLTAPESLIRRICE